MDRLAKILVVDDTPQNIKLVEAILDPLSYVVVEAASGEEALAKVAFENPDLVLLDVVMPGIDGFEVCRRLRADPQTRLLPIVIITAGASEDKVQAIEAGADDFLRTPYDSSELLARIRSLIRIKSYQDTIQAQAAQLEDWSRTLQARVEQQLAEIQRLGQLRRFLAPQLADLLLSSGDESILESHRRDVAVVECALRGFASFSETAEPEEVLAILHEYHEALAELVFQYEGTLHRFAAGTLTVLFNDPLPCLDAAQRAVELAIDMRDRVGRLSVRWRRFGHQLDYVAGIAMGFATLGRIGVKDRFDYEAVGTVMHLAAGLCSAGDPGQILISQRVSAQVEADVETEALGELAVPEFRRLIPAYRVVARRRPRPRETNNESLALTPREREVAALVASGRSNREIALELSIAEGTAANHVQHILDKLGFDTRAQIAAWVAELPVYTDS